MNIPRFRIRTLMIAVAVAGGFLGLARAYPGLAAWFTIFAPPLLLTEFAVRFRYSVEGDSQANFSSAFTLILLFVRLCWVCFAILTLIII